MHQQYEWLVNGNNFFNRRDCILYCHNNNINVGESKFYIPTLPNVVEEPKNLNLYAAAKPMIDDFNSCGKKIILMFSGGPDSTLALHCFLRNGMAPDEIVIYTVDIFDGKSPYNTYIMETEQAKKYLYNLKEKFPALKKSKIREIILDTAYCENIYSDINWTEKYYGMDFHVDSYTSMFHHPLIDDSNSVFIRGGATPKIYVENNKFYAYYVDKQSGEATTGQNLSIDFITYNKEFFSAYVCSLIKNTPLHYTQEESVNHSDENLRKFNIPEIKENAGSAPRTFPKGIEKTCSSEYPEDFIARINTTTFKNWVLYIEACRLNPAWFSLYKKGIHHKKEWVEFFHATPGTLSNPIQINLDLP